MEHKGPGGKTCSDSCRAKRSRRLRKQQKERGKESALSPAQREITDRVSDTAPDVAHRIIEEEIRPLVRESITEDTLRAIGDMVALTPGAVEAIREDLASTDAAVRQKAYTLILKYTVGHQAIVRPPDEDRTQPLEIHFNLPRPGQAVDVDADVVDATEVRTCDKCSEEKPLTEFVAESERCVTCFEEQQEEATRILHS